MNDIFDDVMKTIEEKPEVCHFCQEEKTGYWKSCRYGCPNNRDDSDKLRKSDLLDYILQLSARIYELEKKLNGN